MCWGGYFATFAFVFEFHGTFVFGSQDVLSCRINAIKTFFQNFQGCCHDDGGGEEEKVRKKRKEGRKEEEGFLGNGSRCSIIPVRSTSAPKFPIKTNERALFTAF